MSIVAVACQIAHYLIMGYGVYACWLAYRSSQKKAWLLVGIFCMSAFLVLGMRQLSKVMHRDARNQQQIQAAGTDGQVVPVRTVSVNFPIFPLLLVIGLSSLAEDEIKRNRKAQPENSA